MLKLGCRQLLTAVLLLGLMSGPVNAAVSHIVFVWAKEDISKKDVKAMISNAEMLSKINGVKSMKVGTAVPSDRSTVDDSYDVGITLIFDTVDAMEAYLEHPEHIKYVSTYVKPYAEALLVYDIEHD
ncbi:MAG: hypothetical protein ACI90U_002570 [Pseudomonadales bacterium]|jgi:hypothetical protein